VANQNNNTVSVLIGIAYGFFTTQIKWPIGQSPTSVISKDFNNDGNHDLAVANFKNSTISLLRGNGNGTFRPQQLFAVGSKPSAIISDDFNNDTIGMFMRNMNILRQNLRFFGVLKLLNLLSYRLIFLIIRLIYYPSVSIIKEMFFIFYQFYVQNNATLNRSS
jgi:DNA-binding beta-propeller fold protein YncE